MSSRVAQTTRDLASAIWAFLHKIAWPACVRSLAVSAARDDKQVVTRTNRYARPIYAPVRVSILIFSPS
jgi:hypothetical protein